MEVFIVDVLNKLDIKEYVSKFIAESFEDVDVIVSHNLELIEELSLQEPKVDYFKAEEVLLKENIEEVYKVALDFSFHPDTHNVVISPRWK